ncbi:hypothetical protein HaLaN_28032 [Haematococcus lacustris]|uniref:Uncharacterized protein n=1 Tax=Haematococcus lacustris TaxID=44745 RepID=A0A6A0A9P6_HAELA|nr:hypothetical protein HaLaN_28032 [Haematococcus lacustris]
MAQAQAHPHRHAGSCAPQNILTTRLAIIGAPLSTMSHRPANWVARVLPAVVARHAMATASTPSGPASHLHAPRSTLTGGPCGLLSGNRGV